MEGEERRGWRERRGGGRGRGEEGVEGEEGRGWRENANCKFYSLVTKNIFKTIKAFFFEKVGDTFIYIHVFESDKSMKTRHKVKSKQFLYLQCSKNKNVKCKM